MKTAAATSHRRFHRTTEIDVDDIETGLDEFQRGRPEFRGVRAHQLPADGVFFIRDVQMMPCSLPIFEVDQESVDFDFGQCVRRTQASSHDSHRSVAVATERGLHDRKSHLDWADHQGTPRRQGVVLRPARMFEKRARDDL